MIINKHTEGLLQNRYGDYLWDGGLISEEDIKIELCGRLAVSGAIEAKGSIIANDDIICQRSIRCGGDIIVNNLTAYADIVAGGKIKAFRDIVTRSNVSAGESIEANHSIVIEGAINAGGWIRAGKSIIADMGITAKGPLVACESIRSCSFIQCKGLIFAGVATAYYGLCEEGDVIRCAELLEGEIASGRLSIINLKEEDNDEG